MKRLILLVLAAVLLPTAVLGQSIPTATINGKVTADGAALPGVTVTIASPNLQGQRTTVTTESGDYLLPLLPPGRYTVTFELAGMQPLTRKLELTSTRTHHLDAELRPSAMSEAITVTADTPLTAAVESTQVATNFKHDLVEQLPIGRSITAAALLAPGLNSNGPGGNTMVSGAMSFDSLYLVNGAVVNENLRGQPHNLFIEDAIQETTVLTGAVPAEYGHFTGGVISAITKSGGNDFAGSIRDNLTNESWIAKTPKTLDQEDQINQVYEATLGGPALRDRLWFFGAGRSAETNDIRQTVMGAARQGDQDASGNQLPIGSTIAPITYPHGTEEFRTEVKLTGSLMSKHTLIGSYLDIQASETNQTGQTVMDLDSLVAERETPNSMVAVNYTGVLTERIFLNAQYSDKEFQFVNSGSPYFDIIKGTLITDRARGTRYWSPTFRATSEGERRDIRTYTAKATYFLSTRSLGSHEIAAGFEDFNEVRAVNNYQNGSDYRISVPSTIVRGNQIFPRMPGGATGTLTRISWLPIFVLSQGSDYTTRSAFLQDRWNLSDHWTFSAGVRYDKNDAISGDGSFKIADDSAFSPRLAAHYDVFADSRLIVTASYGEYVGRLAEGAANDADPAGRSATLQWDYRGPNINNDVNAPTASLIPTDQAIKMIMDWFFANGGTDRRPFRTTPSLPGVDTVLDLDGLSSPMVREYSVGFGTSGQRWYARADVIRRDWGNFYTTFRDLTTGRTQDQFGTEYDRSILTSSSDVYNRQYTAVQTQANYRVRDRWSLGGTYTWSRLVGNVTGEDSGSGPLAGGNAEYPEYKQESWNFPTGYLTGDQRHRARLWATYDLPTPAGDFNVSVLQTFDSGTRTSLDAAIDSRPYVTNPGYLTPPGTVTYYFGGRGTIKADDITSTNLAVNYRLKLLRGIELFVQPEVLNLFNEQGVESFDEELLTAVDCPPQTGSNTLQAPCPAKGLTPFDPFTTTPVENVHYLKGPGFGEPDSEGDYQAPRTFRLSVGLRF